jgi:CheY-like chemotaxis protein
MTPKKVLLAEDDSDDQQIFYDFLYHRTDLHLLPVAENGVALFHFLESVCSAGELPDLIILDQNMPKRNGLQTLRMLKEDPRYAAIPVMVYSTYTDQQLIDACLEVGASAVMTKPITKEGYEEMIDAFLKVVV